MQFVSISRNNICKQAFNLRVENATFEIYWWDINIHAKVATKGWAKAPLKYSEKDAFLRMFLEKKKKKEYVPRLRIFLNEERFNKNGTKLYSSLPPFFHFLFHSPPRSYIFLNAVQRILWRVLYEFLLKTLPLFYHRYIRYAK